MKRFLALTLSCWLLLIPATWAQVDAPEEKVAQTEIPEGEFEPSVPVNSEELRVESEVSEESSAEPLPLIGGAGGGDQENAIEGAIVEDPQPVDLGAQLQELNAQLQQLEQQRVELEIELKREEMRRLENEPLPEDLDQKIAVLEKRRALLDEKMAELNQLLAEASGEKAAIDGAAAAARQAEIDAANAVTAEEVEVVLEPKPIDPVKQYALWGFAGAALLLAFLPMLGGKSE